MADTVKSTSAYIAHSAVPSQTRFTLNIDYIVQGCDGANLYDYCFQCVSTLILHFLNGGRLAVSTAESVARHACAVLEKEENVLELSEPIAVVGDTEGQLYDVAKIVATSSPTFKEHILFLGNYIGSGGFNCECALLVLFLKICFPTHVHLIRGNNETKVMTEVFKLKEECMKKYGPNLYHLLLTTFNALPLAATVSKKYFCVHGGLSPLIARIADIHAIDRFREVPIQGALCDLLWSDPHWDCDNPIDSDSTSFSQGKYFTPSSGHYDMNPTFTHNEYRGCGYLFNYACVKYFIMMNKLQCVIRAHGVQDEGFKIYRTLSHNNHPCMISIFSAPNYCDTFANMGVVLFISKSELHMRQLFCSPHPFVLHEHNALTWSLPFVAQCTHDILSDILQQTKRRASTSDVETVVILSSSRNVQCPHCLPE